MITRSRTCIILLACSLAQTGLAEDQVMKGSWTWPDQGLSLWNPKGDTQSGAIVLDMLPFGDQLAVAGIFRYAGGIQMRYVSLWDGSGWSDLAGASPDNVAESLLASGGNLYVGGGFEHVGTLHVNGLARWDGKTWSALGGGPGNGVLRMVE